MTKISWVGFLLLLIARFSVAQSNQQLQFGIHLDVLSPVLSLPLRVSNSDQQNACGFLRFSPEFEFFMPENRGLSLIVDGEYFRTEQAFGREEIIGSESGKPSQIVTLESFTIGIRKYFYRIEKGGPYGPFLEFQTGYVQERVDTAYRFLSAEPRIDDFSKSGYLAMRARLGYQFSIIKPFTFSPSLMLDVRRMAERDNWFRILILEFNLGIIF